MSLYTDTQLRRKENVTILRSPGRPEDGLTPQKVIFANPANIYEGTLNGSVNSTGGSISGGTITDATLYNVKLSGSIGFPSGLDLGLINLQLTALQQDVQLNAENINEEENARIADTVELRGMISATSKDLSVNCKSLCLWFEGIDYTTSSNISKRLTDVEKDLRSYSDSISSKLDLEIDARELAVNNEISSRLCSDIILDKKIDSLILNLREDVNTYVESLTKQDEAIRSYAESVEISSLERDDKILEKLEKHADENLKQFYTLEKTLLSTIENDKHYSLYGLGGELLFSYPYQLKDFAINVINTGVNDFVLKSSNDITVGVASKLENGSYKVSFSNPINDAEIAKMVKPGAVFVFSTSMVAPTGADDYHNYYIKLELNFDGKGNNRILLYQENAEWYALWHNSQRIGTLTNVKRTEDNSKLISGYITIDAGPDSEFRAFSNFYYVPFDNEANRRLTSGSEVIELNSDDNSFTFYKGLEEQWYSKVQDAETDLEFGLILSSHAILKDGLIESISVDIMQPFRMSNVVLDSSNNFVNECLSNYIVSADTSLSTISVVERDAYFKYRAYLSTDTKFEGLSFASVVPNKKNVELSTESYNAVSVIVTDGIAEKFKNVEFKLNVDSMTNPIKIWNAVSTFEDGSNITLKFDGYNLYIHLFNAENGVVADRHYIVNPAKLGYYTTDTIVDPLTIVYASKQIDFTYQEMLTTFISKYEVDDIRLNPGSLESPVFVSLNSETGLLRFNVPEKADQYSKVSREFATTFSFGSKDDSHSLLSILFQDGIAINYNGHDEIIIDTDTWHTLQFREIALNRFLVQDLDVKESDSKIEHLKEFAAAISSRTDELTLSIEQLSNLTAHDVDDLSTKTIGISSDLYELSNSMSAISTDFDARISANLSSIDDLKKLIHGQLTFRNVLDLDIEQYDTAKDGSISALFYNNAYSKPEFYEKADVVRGLPLRTGFYYVLDATLNPSKTFTVGGLSLLKNDWLIVNENTVLSNLTSAKVSKLDAQDADVFHLSANNVVNGNNHFYGLLTIEESKLISTAIDSEEVVDSHIDSLSVENLSIDSSKLIVDNEKSIEDLSIDIYETLSSNVEDLSAISSDLSTLSHKYNERTLSTDIVLTKTIPGSTLSAVVDKLLIVDEVTFDLYALTIRNGALNINKVKLLTDAYTDSKK